MASTLTRSQRKLAKTLIRVGYRQGATPKEIKAAIETALVESNLSNPSYGDADSEGWRQERRSLYPNPTNVKASARRFYRETRAVRGKYGSAGDLAAAVQRPAAQYRGRYQQRSGEADAILAALSGQPTNYGGGGANGGSSTQSIDVPGIDNAAARQQARLQYLQAPSHENFMSLGLALRGLQDRPGSKVLLSTDPVTGRTGAEDAGSLVASIKAEAQRINNAKVPYQWGGGHQAKQARGSKVTPLDCSGAVSRALGIDPRVSGQFTSWGKPGRGKKVTIYANGTHVLMEIDGHFWGTSHANPGGGAGWIPRSQISKQYLKRFVARHPAGA